MPNDVRIRAGTTVALVNLGGTDAQVEAAFLRYCKSRGISIEGTKTEILTRIAEDWIDAAKRHAKAVQLAELTAAQAAANQAQVDSDNPL